ncbi:MAG: glutamate formimidoyltransferase [Sphingomonadales bacterium]|nr:glutamate formimidoyltransferase [Sphingomonadales bacterium]
MNPIIECVPNFSEGRDLRVLDEISAAISSTEGVRLLHRDPGKATNRTVYTFVGHPEAVVEAAYRAISVATRLIDMRQHQGEHARMGATDVCPFIPISGISMEETVAYSRTLAKRVGEELNIPVYLYEASATHPSRRNLADIRAGEYEGLPAKMQDPDWKPDFGPAVFNPQSGATVVGARPYLVAYNVNLNTPSVRLANSVAFDVREAGRVKREGHPITGKVVQDETGQPVRIPGTLKAVKAVGWYIEEYKTAQISMNLTDLSQTPLHIAFDEVVRAATARGIRVTGSELVGLVPLICLTDSGRHFLRKMGRSEGVSEKELIECAVRTMGLSELSPFHPEERIIEYKMAAASDQRLIHLSLSDLSDETASESPAPGGGSISAAVGALAAALGAMVANLSAGKRGWEAHFERFSVLARECQSYKEALLKKVDEDTFAFYGIMNAFSLPKSTPEEQLHRRNCIELATDEAIRVPLETMKQAFACLEPIRELIENGNPNSVSDVGVALLCIRSAIYGAWMNVTINAASLADQKKAADYRRDADALLQDCLKLEPVLLDAVRTKLGG